VADNAGRATSSAAGCGKESDAVASPIFWMVVCFVFGAATGSFLNVVIWRLPTDRSILWPGSHCPHCYRPIAWYWNLPILGWFILKGRGRCCGQPISPRYWIIELATALLFVGVFAADFLWRVRDLGPTAAEPVELLAAHWPILLGHLYLFAALLAASVIDLDHKVIPGAITTPGIILGVALSAAVPAMQPTPLPVLGQWPHLSSFADSLLGLVAGAGITWVVRFVGTAAFKREAMGMGDVHLMGMVGAILGWEVAILAFFIGPFFGLLLVLIGSLRPQKREIPYGPGLSLGTVAAWLSAAHIVAWLTRTPVGTHY
jgi:leader peptidase (prepilin peptidase)/N-methyltransferase